MEKNRERYLAPEAEEIVLQTKAGILSGSDNMLRKQNDYDQEGGNSEGFEW